MPGLPSRRDSGFALVLAMLVLLVLGAIAAGFAHSLRGHMRETAALAARAEAELLADAGVELALLDLLEVREGRSRQLRFPIGKATACAIGDGSIEVVVGDESGRVDINAAGGELLTLLLAGTGAPPAAAAAMAAAILDHRDADDATRDGGSELAEYRAAGNRDGPKNAPFDSVDELAQVLSLDAKALARIRPFVTVHSGSAGLTPEAAEPELLAALLAASPQPAVRGADRRSLQAGFRRVFPQLVTVTPSRSFRVRATARMRGAAFSREAVIVLSTSRSRPYLVRDWRQVAAADTAGAEALHPCPGAAAAIAPAGG